jgi:hypothetical protein
MIVIAARPSMGKTSLAMNIVENVVLEQKLPTAVFSLEMSAESLVLRMMCSIARVNLRSIREGFMSESDFPKLTSAAGRLANAPLFIDDSAGLSILQLRARARRLHQQHGVKLFVVDYLAVGAFYCAPFAGKPAAGNRGHFERHQGAGEGIGSAGAGVEPVEPRAGEGQKPQAAVERFARVGRD